MTRGREGGVGVGGAPLVLSRRRRPRACGSPQPQASPNKSRDFSRGGLEVLRQVFVCSPSGARLGRPPVVLRGLAAAPRPPPLPRRRPLGVGPRPLEPAVQPRDALRPVDGVPDAGDAPVVPRVVATVRAGAGVRQGRVEVGPGVSAPAVRALPPRRARGASRARWAGVPRGPALPARPGGSGRPGRAPRAGLAPAPVVAAVDVVPRVLAEDAAGVRRRTSDAPRVQAAAPVVGAFGDAGVVAVQVDEVGPVDEEVDGAGLRASPAVVVHPTRDVFVGPLAPARRPSRPSLAPFHARSPSSGAFTPTLGRLLPAPPARGTSLPFPPAAGWDLSAPSTRVLPRGAGPLPSRPQTLGASHARGRSRWELPALRPSTQGPCRARDPSGPRPSLGTGTLGGVVSHRMPERPLTSPDPLRPYPHRPTG